MSHGGLITGDIHGKLGDSVSLKKDGLRIQRGHNSHKNTAGSDAQWVRWLSLAICNKVWKWLKARDLVKLSQRDFIKYNIAISPYLTFEQYSQCECPSAPWILSKDSEGIDIQIEEPIFCADRGFLDEIIWHRIYYGISFEKLRKRNADLIKRDRTDTTIYSQRPPTEGLERFQFLGIDGEKWAVLWQTTRSSAYPSLVEFPSTYATASDYVEQHQQFFNPYMTARQELRYDGQFSGFHLEFIVQSGDPSVEPAYTPGLFGNRLPSSMEEQLSIANLPHMALSYAGEIITTPFGATLAQPVQLQTLCTWESAVSYDRGFEYKEWAMFASRYLWSSDMKPVLMTIGGIATSYYTTTSEYQNKRTEQAKQAAIASWRQHRVNGF